MQIDIPLLPEQQEILNDKSKVRTIVACRRWGKSTTLAADMLNTGLSIPKGYSLLVNPYQFHSNNFYKQLFESTPNIHECYAKMPPGIANPKVHPHPHIVWKGGHTLDMKTWNNTLSNVGGYLNRVYLDESADFEGDEVFKILLPKLTDKRGLMVVAGTVTTETSFIWQMFLRGLGRDRRFRSWRYTWKDAIVYKGKQGEAELEFLYDTMSTLDFQTQLECIPVGDDSTAFPALARCLVDIIPPPSPQAGRRYCCVADIARSKDFTCVVVIDDTGLVVYEEQFQKGLDYALYAKKCADVARMWQVGDAFTYDDTGCGGSGGQRKTENSIGKYYKEAYPGARPWIWSGNSEIQSKHEVVQFFNCLTQEKRAFKAADGSITELPKLRIPRRFSRLVQQLQNYRCVVDVNTQRLTFRGRYGHDDSASACILAAFRAFKHNLFGKTIGGNRIVLSSKELPIEHLD